jgi:hypothetical protein
MISAQKILQCLPMYTGTVEVIADDQNVYDIIRGVKQIHKRYADDYDKIADYFIGETGEDTCRNIFEFLRRSSFYYVEGEDLQTLRSPSAILATGRVHGIDCKNYALFIGGVLDAINRSGKQYIPFCYRFASDKLFDATPCHVFIVAYPNTEDEMWVDPIPQVTYFDERLTYYYHTDKNYKAMSLQIISGRSTGKQIGFIDPIMIQTILQAIPLVGQIQPNNSQNWTASDWGWAIVKDEDPRPWINFPVFFRNNPQFLKTNPYSDPDTGHVYTMDEKIDMVRRKAALANKQQEVEALLIQNGYVTNANTILPNLYNNVQQASTNKLLTYGLIGAGVLMIANQRKKVAGIGSPVLLGAAVAAYFLLRKDPTDLSVIKGDIIRTYGITSEADKAFLDTVPEETLRGIANGTISITSIAS